MTKRKNRDFAFEFENNETPTIMLGQYYGVEEPNEPQDERLNGESGDEFYELFEVPQPVPDIPVPEPPVLEEVPQNRELNTMCNYFKAKCIKKNL